MFLEYLWFGMIAASLLWGMLTGQGKEILPAVLEGTGSAVTVTLHLLSGYLFFCGMIAIVNNLKIQKIICYVTKPVLNRLLGHVDREKATEAVCMNLSANLLGLGNAATPYGIEAARQLEQTSDRHGLYMLLILNATSLQLLPTTVLTLRVAAGSVDPNAILLPSILSTLMSTATGVLLGLFCRKLSEVKHAA